MERKRNEKQVAVEKVMAVGFFCPGWECWERRGQNPDSQLGQQRWWTCLFLVLGKEQKATIVISILVLQLKLLLDAGVPTGHAGLNHGSSACPATAWTMHLRTLWSLSLELEMLHSYGRSRWYCQIRLQPGPVLAGVAT